MCKAEDAAGLKRGSKSLIWLNTCSSCRADGAPVSKRMDTKMLIRKLKESNPHVEENIFNSVHNVSLDTLISYQKNGIAYDFLDDY